MTGKRGRPPGPRQADRKRNLFVYLLVADFMDIGLTRENAVKVAAGLLAAEDRDERRFSEFDKLFVRKTILAPRSRLWKDGQKQVEVDVDGDSISVPTGALVWKAWERAWGRHADYGIPDTGLFLDPASLRRIYDEFAAEIASKDSVICPECGHANVHNPGRGESFMLGDPCRKCGNDTGWVPSDP